MTLSTRFGGIALGLLLTAPAVADMNSDMNQFFDKLNFASNTTAPAVWQGQAAGYISGGSIYARTGVKQIQLISMSLPDINAGCGGIDAYLGAFSFINGEQLQRFTKQIMSNAAGYFFDLALQTTVPELKDAKDFIQKMASDINSMNMSSCQAAQGIVGGLFPRTQVYQQKICQDIAGESNIFADWAASQQGCTVGGKMNSVLDKAGDKDKERISKNINIMWDALSKNRMFDGNKELKEFVMTLIAFMRLRMFTQIGNLIFYCLFIAFFLVAICTLLWRVSIQNLTNGLIYWWVWMVEGWPSISPSETLYHLDYYGKTLTYTAKQVLLDSYVSYCGQLIWREGIFACIVAAVACVTGFVVTVWILGRQGKQQSEDEITGGRTLTDNPAVVANMLKRDGMASDIIIDGLPLLKTARSKTSAPWAASVRVSHGSIAS